VKFRIFPAPALRPGRIVEELGFGGPALELGAPWFSGSRARTKAGTPGKPRFAAIGWEALRQQGIQVPSFGMRCALVM